MGRHPGQWVDMATHWFALESAEQALASFEVAGILLMRPSR